MPSHHGKRRRRKKMFALLVVAQHKCEWMALSYEDFLGIEIVNLIINHILSFAEKMNTQNRKQKIKQICEIRWDMYI